MSSLRFSVHRLGWRPVHAEQLSAQDFELRFPVRVACVQRGRLITLSERGEIAVSAPLDKPIAVGDWVLLDIFSHRFARALEPASLLARLAAGDAEWTQAIAANVDAVFIVTSCAHEEEQTRRSDFNLARMERYLALVRDARIEPVIVLTKVDLASQVGALLQQIASIAHGAHVIAVDARDSTQAAALLPWLGTGKTVALVGSSGVGKSTLTTTLTGQLLPTGAIREADGKGRHTTTARRMLAVPDGGWIIDTPGMRELKIGAADAGVRSTFADLEQLAERCKFRDCRHRGELGCAVAAAIADGVLAARRLESYLKLQREVRHATQTIHERREVERKFGRMQRAALKQRRRERSE